MLFRRRVSVRKPNGLSTSFSGVAYTHDGPRNSIAHDRWYQVNDVVKYLEEEGVKIDVEDEREERIKPWHELVRKYNTTLQGLSYDVRDLKVSSQDRFMNAEFVQEKTGFHFE